MLFHQNYNLYLYLYMNHLVTHKHYFVMFIIMCLAGILSTMNVWTDKLSDIRLSLNDVYMIMLMNGYMFLFMGVYDGQTYITLIGTILVVLNIYFIRTQFMVSQNQYILGMIPHHSMAIHMSKKLLKKQNNVKTFLENIIDTQEKEIDYMKKNEQ